MEPTAIIETKGMKVQIRTASKKDIAFISWVLVTAHRGHLKRGLWDFMVHLGYEP